jgi:hypothetical protein
MGARNAKNRSVGSLCDPTDLFLADKSLPAGKVERRVDILDKAIFNDLLVFPIHTLSPTMRGVF